MTTQTTIERPEKEPMGSCFTVEQYENREQWLAGRQHSVGASDAASVVGLSNYQSPYGLWVEKTEPPQPFREMDEIQRWGILLEPLIREEFNRVSGVMLDTVPPYTIYRDKERPYVSASLDAVGPENRPGQLKTAHFAQANIWAKKVPLQYMCQCQQEIHVMGADCGYIAVLKDGFEFAYHKVNRHQKFIDRLLSRIDHFWLEYVQKRVAPPIDYSEATRKAIMRLYPKPDDTVVDIPDELVELANELPTLQEQIKTLEKRSDEIGNKIRAAIGPASYGRLYNGGGFSFKANGHGTRTLRRCKKVSEPSE